MKHNCRWVKVDRTYCEKPVKYKIVLDDDNNRVRKYNTFCEEHQKLVDIQEQEEEDDMFKY